MYQTSDKAIKETDFDANAELQENYFGVETQNYISKKCANFIQE